MGVENLPHNPRLEGFARLPLTGDDGELLHTNLEDKRAKFTRALKYVQRFSEIYSDNLFSDTELSQAEQRSFTRVVDKTGKIFERKYGKKIREEFATLFRQHQEFLSNSAIDETLQNRWEVLGYGDSIVHDQQPVDRNITRWKIGGNFPYIHRPTETKTDYVPVQRRIDLPFPGTVAQMAPSFEIMVEGGSKDSALTGEVLQSLHDEKLLIDVYEDMVSLLRYKAELAADRVDEDFLFGHMAAKHTIRSMYPYIRNIKDFLAILDQKPEHLKSVYEELADTVFQGFHDGLQSRMADFSFICTNDDNLVVCLQNGTVVYIEYDPTTQRVRLKNTFSSVHDFIVWGNRSLVNG